ncbi:hypothetical protein ACFP1I_08705 [Dyadobacter subterraneus]|uniref:Anti-sigma factor n=1 Tax=Dyadobacter subterraneus TaxID=2773304 RepID=A0ABR9WE60_9BACT|nr:hypothetical protein [Dyadobacter subterraneus]MBE9463781.1 hypothetical protein [Dyadobacter subterraneus]
MEKDKLEKLLEKYWNAETTLAEEKLIKAYLSKQGAYQIHPEDKDWFAAIQDFRDIGHDKVHFTIEKKKRKFVMLGYPVWLIAAVTVLVWGLSWLGVDYNQKLNTQRETEALARRAAEESLMSMSNALHQAYQHLNEPSELPNNAVTEN